MKVFDSLIKPVFLCTGGQIPQYCLRYSSGLSTELLA